MTQRVLPCPECLTLCNATPIGEEVLSSEATGEVNGVARGYQIDCPVHGRRFVRGTYGHHSTNLKALMTRTFSKADMRRLRATLSPEEWKRFTDVREGKARGTDEDIARWKAALP